MNKLMMLPVFAAVLMMIGSVSLAEATHANWGYIKDGSNGVHPAKATFEKPGEYFWDDTQDSSGYYFKTITPNGSTGWTISAMADGYDRDVKTSQSEGASNNNFDISTRNENTVKFKMAYDDTTSVSLTEARNELVRAEPWFEDEHGIIFDEWNDSSSFTTSGQSTSDCEAMITHVQTSLQADWQSSTYGTSDILAAYSDGHMGANEVKACGERPSSGNQHPVHYVDIRTGDDSWERDRRVAHELSHNYGLTHATSCTNTYPSLMAVPDGGSCEYITNWSPSNDSTMESNRGWYN